MPNPKAQKDQNQTKTIVSALLLVVSVGIFLHRLPNRDYVEVHADKPRPKKPEVEDVAPPPIVLPEPKPNPLPNSQMPERSAPIRHAPPPVAVVETNEVAESGSVVKLKDACKTEIGLLCYRIPMYQVPQCLRTYQDALRADCRTALTGTTMLMIAATDGTLADIKALLHGGADLNARNSNGATALMFAAQVGRVEVVRYLLKSGADASVKANNGLTALDLATQTNNDIPVWDSEKQTNQKELIELLKNARTTVKQSEVKR